MIYLDHGATSFPKPPSVRRAVELALRSCTNPARGGYLTSRQAERIVYGCREEAGALFDCSPEQVVFTMNCTHGLNIAIRSLVRPGMKVAVSGFEHNAVMRPLYALGAEIIVAGRRLFDREDALRCFRQALDQGAEVAVVTQVSNVFGYVLPVDRIVALCRERGVPFILDAAQSAGHIPISMEDLGAAFIAMPGHKGLLGPMGTGLLLCREGGEPLLYGGTGTSSREHGMPPELPERLEAGTMNVPGIAGLREGIRFVRKLGPERIGQHEQQIGLEAVKILKDRGFQPFHGPHQAGTLSFVPDCGCEELAQALGKRGIAVRAGLHCAPLAHESAGTLETGTVRLSFGWDSGERQLSALKKALDG